MVCIAQILQNNFTLPAIDKKEIFMYNLQQK